MLPERDNLDAIIRDFSWKIPRNFNIGVACCDAWADVDFDRIALRRWSRSGIIHETSYGYLRDRSNRLANAFKELGAAPGMRAAIILPQCLEAVISHLAIYKSAMIAVPLARLFAADALEYRLKHAGVSVIITNRAGQEKISPIRDRLENLKAVICIDEDTDEKVLHFQSLTARASADFTPVDTRPNTPALLIFTSGTTGQPKGALHGHRVLLGHIPGVQFHHAFMPKPGDMAWTPADWAWAGGLLNILLPCLYLGVPVVYGGLDRFDPEMAFALMTRMKVANAFIPPTALRLMKSVDVSGFRDDLCLRSIGSGGESLGKEAQEWALETLGITVNEFYGQTECNLVLSSCHAIGVSKPGAIGKPVPGHNVAVINPDGDICPPEEPGEIAIARPDPVMFLGYWEDEEATKAKFSGSWMLTGDQCVVDGEGYYHFVGREDDIINSAGYRVGPGEIEDCLVSHPAISLAAAIGKPDPVRTEIIKAYVVLSEGATASKKLRADIKAHVKNRLAANIYPREIEFVDSIPLTTTGKVIRRIFREQARRESEAHQKSKQERL
jgi:acetyl-CoA synthetase